MKIDYEITVDVSNADIETKKRVQDAFFKLGFEWGCGGTDYLHLHDVRTYTNKISGVGLSPRLMYSEDDREPTHTIDQLLELAGMKTETRLIPFDLEKALAGETVVTRDGREVSQVTLFDCSSKYPLVAVVDGEVYGFAKTGGHYISGHPSSLDLFMKPKTRIINGFEVPAPVTDPDSMKVGDKYYCADGSESSWFFWSSWAGDETDKMWLERGLVFLRKEDAIANAKAMLGINPYGDDDE